MEDPERVPRFGCQRLATLFLGDLERKIGEGLHGHHIERLAQFADRAAAERAIIRWRLARHGDSRRDLALGPDCDAVPDEMYEGCASEVWPHFSTLWRARQCSN